MANDTVKILHEWTVPFTKEVDETTDEIVNGQSVKVTRKVRKEVPIKMALKKLTRREAADADLFYGKEYNRFLSMGFLPRNIIINRYIDLSGGVLSEKERVNISSLIEKQIELEADLVRATNSPKEVQDKIRAELHAVKGKLVDLNAANESNFLQTPEAKAQNQLNSWLAFTLVMIERDGKWVPYFEGQGDTMEETFKQREQFMWKLEEEEDEFYVAAVEKISFYIGLFSRGVATPEQFKLIDEEWQKQIQEKQAQAQKATETPAPESAPTPDLPPTSEASPTA